MHHHLILQATTSRSPLREFANRAQSESASAIRKVAPEKQFSGCERSGQLAFLPIQNVRVPVDAFGFGPYHWPA
jgi:hypothetical protein